MVLLFNDGGARGGRNPSRLSVSPKQRRGTPVSDTQDMDNRWLRTPSGMWLRRVGDHTYTIARTALLGHWRVCKYGQRRGNGTYPILDTHTHRLLQEAKDAVSVDVNREARRIAGDGCSCFNMMADPECRVHPPGSPEGVPV